MADSRKRKSIRIGIALAALVVLATSAGSHETRPSWMDDPTRDYGPDTYIVGVGSGDTEEAAVENARADLAAGFRARVQSVMTVDDDVRESFGKNGDTFDRLTRSRKSTEVTVCEDLSNITLGGKWHDDFSGRHHALVYIRRDEARRTLGAEIDTRLSRISEILANEAGAADVVFAYGAAIRAVTLFGEYEALSAQLRVVSEGETGDVDAALGERLLVWLNDVGSRLTLRILSAPPELEPLLRDMLGTCGFQVVEGQALLTAELVYATNPAPASDYYIFENWEMSLRLRRAGERAELITLNKIDKAGHKSREAARERCLNEARRALTDEFGMDLDVFLSGQQ
jgi:LPP20 lipoprotein